MTTFAERFWVKVDVAGVDECWRWLGGKNPKGYGNVSTPKGPTTAHRVAYELAVGAIPAGMVIDHVRARGCIRRDCCNPRHLEAVTQAVNLLRGRTVNAAAAARTHCPHGHPLVGDNLYMWRGRRHCQTCRTRRNHARPRKALP